MTKWYKIITFLLFLSLILLFTNTESFALLMDGQFSAITSSDGTLILIALTLFLMTIQNLFTIVPLVLLITFNLALFGFVYGYVWSVVSSIVGAIICFYATRYWFQEFLLARISDKITRKIGHNAFAFVFIARIVPFVPTSLINIAASISAIKVRHFIISTLLGNMIYFFVLSLIIQGIMEIELEPYVFIGIGVMFILIYVGHIIRKKKRANVRRNDLQL